MNEQEREKIEDLIRGFLDEDLTERQQTELKRLAQHDPSLKQELHSLYRQKELLSALPVEKAPRELAEGIRSRLERRMILPEPAAEIRPIGRAHLLFRRIAAAAAMLFIPLGILGILVFQIMKPADEVSPSSVPVAGVDTSGDLARLERNSESPNTEKAVPVILGQLTLITDQPISVNERIKNAVVANQLLSGSSAERTEERSVYRIQCGQAQMLSFSRDLSKVWSVCSRRQLVLSSDNPAAQKTVVIEGIRPEQMEILIGESNPVRMHMLASHMERMNRIDPADPLRGIRPNGRASEGSDEIVLQPVKPKIAWNEERQDPKRTPGEFGKDGSADGPQMILVIEVKSDIGGK